MYTFNFSERELNEPTITDEPEAGEGNSKFYLKPKNSSSSLLQIQRWKMDTVIIRWGIIYRL